MEFAGKRAVITGAASGIGKALAQELVARGARVVMADIAEQSLAEAAAALGDAAAWQVCDVADHAALEALAAFVQENLGGCDLAFANAGVIMSGRDRQALRLPKWTGSSASICAVSGRRQRCSPT